MAYALYCTFIVVVQAVVCYPLGGLAIIYVSFFRLTYSCDTFDLPDGELRSSEIAAGPTCYHVTVTFLVKHTFT